MITDYQRAVLKRENAVGVHIRPCAGGFLAALYDHNGEIAVTDIAEHDDGAWSFAKGWMIANMDDRRLIRLEDKL